VTWLWIIVLGGIALTWLIQGTTALLGMSRIPRMGQARRVGDAECPVVSILFAARDEADKLPEALASFLAQDYPQYEVIGVDDRSRDATGAILDEWAARDPRSKAMHVGQLPAGWLGKPHALAAAYTQSKGEWLVFTDADVCFAPGLLRHAVALALAKRWDHLTLLAAVDMPDFWEKVAITYLGIGFVLGVRPWRVDNPRAGTYMGVGAFQLIRRSTYEAIGTHRRLAMEVVDDMKLGKLVKQEGFRSGVAPSDGFVAIRWHEGLGKVIEGLTKNMFAGTGYSVLKTVIGVLGIFGISILPFLALPFVHGVAQILAAVSVGFAVLFQGILVRGIRLSPLYGLTHPLGAAIFSYILLRSMVVTLWRGGVLWRNTFYPLDELRRGMV
jgi:glycosyl transferase family 2